MDDRPSNEDTVMSNKLAILRDKQIGTASTATKGIECMEASVGSLG